MVVVTFLYFLMSGFVSSEMATKVMLPSTKLYSATDFESSVAVTLSINDEVTIKEEILVNGVMWYKVDSHGVEGYLLASDVYSSYKNNSVSYLDAKIKTEKLGEKVNFYQTYSKNSEVVDVGYDGQNIKVVKNNVDYGEFSLVEYNGDYYFVLSNNTTTGLSYSQNLGLMIIGVVLFVLIIILGICIAIKKNKNKKGKREQ